MLTLSFCHVFSQPPIGLLHGYLHTVSVINVTAFSQPPIRPLQCYFCTTTVSHLYCCIQDHLSTFRCWHLLWSYHQTPALASHCWLLSPTTITDITYVDILYLDTMIRLPSYSWYRDWLVPVTYWTLLVLTLAYTIITHLQYMLFVLVASCDPIGPQLHYTFLSIQTHIPVHVQSYSHLCQKSFLTIISTLHRAM